MCRPIMPMTCPSLLRKLVAHVAILQIGKKPGVERLMVELCLLQFADQGIDNLRIVRQ
ncbi:Uncharacterised protein [Enterobacter asburiae]|uniref:Uncharacterized protein n=1 Tax=Enterobacter asburiae TaxID=61645 RepID=A0A376FKR5_ENTAS|nr:Uncharacterised protein [Enterobacter asburiae]